MLNQIVIVGRVAKLIETKNKDKTVISGLVLKVPRNYHDENGDYQVDFIKCQLSKYLNITVDIKENELVGIRGRLESDDLSTFVIVEKITYLGKNIIK